MGYVVYIHHQHEPGLTVTHAYSSRRGRRGRRAGHGGGSSARAAMPSGSSLGLLEGT